MVSQPRGSTIARISAIVPGQHMSASAGPWPGQSSSSPKDWKSDGHVKIYNSVSARSPLTKSKEKKNREQYKKHECQCSDRLSAVKCSRSTRVFQHSGIEPNPPILLLLTLTTKPLVRINHLKKKIYDSLYFPTCNQFCFAYRTVAVRFFKLNIKARHEILELLNANLDRYIFSHST